MVLSIHTNTGAQIALQSLTRTNSVLEQTQKRVSTGFKVNGAKDDASTFAIAQSMRSEIKGLDAISLSIANGVSITDVAISATESISDLLVEMKAKSIQANQSGLDAGTFAALDRDYQAMLAQLDTVVSSAQFNGINLLDSSLSQDLEVLIKTDGTTTSVSRNALRANDLGLSTTDISTQTNAAVALAAVDAAVAQVNLALASLGADFRKMEVQQNFTNKLQDVLVTGVGNLVDADLAKESAKLQALQIQQQLGVQALAIANGTPQIILSLFQQ